MLTVPRAALQAKTEAQDLSSRFTSPFEGSFHASFQQSKWELSQHWMGIEEEDKLENAGYIGKFCCSSASESRQNQSRQAGRWSPALYSGQGKTKAWWWGALACHARVSSKGKFHRGISVLSPNPLLAADTAGSFMAYPKMPFITAVQHHPTATFQPGGGKSIPTPSWSHSALAQTAEPGHSHHGDVKEQMRIYFFFFTSFFHCARWCGSSAAAWEVETLGEEIETVWKLTSRALHHSWKAVSLPKPTSVHSPLVGAMFSEWNALQSRAIILRECKCQNNWPVNLQRRQRH